MGHSFVHRLAAFVQKKRHLHAFVNLHTIADIHFHGVGGRTIKKFRKFDLEVVRQIAPKVIILELGSNDLVNLSPQTVGSELENLVRELHEAYSVEFVVVGQVLRRRTHDADEYNCKVGKLHQYLKVVLEQLPFCYYWRHRGFWNSKRDLYLLFTKSSLVVSKAKQTRNRKDTRESSFPPRPLFSSLINGLPDVVLVYEFD